MSTRMTVHVGNSPSMTITLTENCSPVLLPPLKSADGAEMNG